MLDKIDSEVILRFIRMTETGCKADIEEARADYLEFYNERLTRLVLNERIARIQEQLDFIEDLKTMIEDMEKH